MKVVVLLGGKSDEREVSLRSGRAVIDSLNKQGYDVTEYDPIVGYEGLNKFVASDCVVLPILHGVGGEDGEVQAYLEKLELKYLGSDSKVSALCFDKQSFKDRIKRMGIATPAGGIVNRSDIGSSEFVSSPYVLKPVDGGSSIDTFIIRDPEHQNYDINVFDKHENMLIETLVEGVEITVPILDSKALPVIEIIPPEGLEFDYENKYNGATSEICPPKNVSSELQAAASTIAQNIHNKLGVRHLSRVDFIIDKYGIPYVLELNTMPGLTSQSLYPLSARTAGINFDKLVSRLVSLPSQA